jgi:hypothetical protein
MQFYTFSIKLNNSSEVYLLSIVQPLNDVEDYEKSSIIINSVSDDIAHCLQHWQ